MALEHQGRASAKPIGRYSQAIKYDIITCLLVLTTCGTSTQARLSVRLSIVITARYNWQSARFNVGQRELARMWGVTERTAKRELAQMRSLEWIRVTTPSGRGRVAQHSINFEAIIKQSSPHWSAIGPDFAARMVGAPKQDDLEPTTNVVPLHTQADNTYEDNGTGWRAVAERLRTQDPTIFDSWISRLTPLQSDADTIVLAAPSKFIAGYINTHFMRRIEAGFSAEEGHLRCITIVSACE